MKKVLSILLIVLIPVVFLMGCGDDPAKSSKKAKVTKRAQKTKSVKVAPLKMPEVVVDNYEYQGAGRRDPFAPLAEEKKPVVIRDTRPLEPLEKFELKQLRLEAVLLGFGEPRAMIKAPDGKSYIVRPGNRMGKNRGEIKQIDKTAVVLNERYQDFSGAVRTGEKRIELPKREGL